jgi:DNA mismatch endonuclease, patch repair protein
MVDRFSKDKRSKIMSAIRSRNTTPEMTVRKTLWSRGLRYRINYGPKKIDIAFPSKKLAVFIDGCFWHSCPLHSHIPKSNLKYWLPKLQKNKERDKATTAQLQSQGWVVLRFCEHELENLPVVIEEIKSKLKS